MKQLFLTTMGYAGAGKSHFAKELALKLGAVRLNSDSMRNSVLDNPENMDSKDGNRVVFGAIDYAASEVLKAGYSVIYDAKCNRRSEREKNAGIASKHGAQHVSVWVQVPRDIAIERTESREVTLDQGRLTKEQREERQTDYLEEPDANEAYVVIDGTKPFDEQYTSFQSQLETKGM